MKHILLGMAALLCAGCSTPYQEMGFGGGVEAQQMTANTYRIVARGNGYTSGTAIQDYALLKAAETTKQAGATHFEVISASDASSVGAVTTPGQATTIITGSTARTDPPPLKWSSLMYGFSPELEDHDADKETQARRDRREAAAG
jgi:hypothetical protein